MDARAANVVPTRVIRAQGEEYGGRIVKTTGGQGALDFRPFHANFHAFADERTPKLGELCHNNATDQVVLIAVAGPDRAYLPVLPKSFQLCRACEIL